MLIYQKCPKCDGQGTVSKPPWVDGDVNEWISTTTGGYQCDICYGAKIIPTPNENLGEQQYVLVPLSDYTLITHGGC